MYKEEIRLMSLPWVVNLSMRCSNSGPGTEEDEPGEMQELESIRRGPQYRLRLCY